MQLPFFKKNNTSGFAMLFAVLVISLILTLAIGISNASLKQYILSSLVKDSQLAFYEADGAVECGVLHDFNGVLPRGLPVVAAPASLVCGSRSYVLDTTRTRSDYFVYNYRPVSLLQSCSSITFDKTVNTQSGSIEGRGYNICDTNNPRNVQRALRVVY